MIVTVDFETYYSKEYSLRRMSEVDYILDPRFQTICCAIKINNEPSKIFTGHAAVANYFSSLPWERIALLSHNMRFDGAIAAWHYHVRPKVYLDTLSMARAMTHILAKGSSLGKVSAYLGLADKGDEVVAAKGKRLEDFGADLPGYLAYCLRDCENCYDIFRIFRNPPYSFPSSELAVIDATMRMFIEPSVKLDRAALVTHLADVQAERERAFERVAHIDRSAFSSNLKFAALLEHLGVDVPTKISPTTYQVMPALARNDRGFRELCDDTDQAPEVQAVLAARLGAKSTIEETRTVTLLNLATRGWGDGTLGWMPVPLKYYGAHTGRFSGDDGFNFQNLKRGSPLRSAIRAPEGRRIVHRDASQIEARMVAWLARCVKLLRAFAEGRDVYSEFASTVYNRTVTKANVGDRFVGKTSILGLGYGMGALRFMHTLFIGNGGLSLKVPPDESERIVRLYRSEYDEIPELWETASKILNRMIALANAPAKGEAQGLKPRVNGLGGVITPPEIRAITYDAEGLILPNGMRVRYPELSHQMTAEADGSQRQEITYAGVHGVTRLFGGKLVENISQALARIVITDAMIRVKHNTGFSPFLSTHDSLDYVCDADQAEALDDLLEHEFAVRPAWAPDLPLASEGGWGLSLMDAERRVNR